MDGVILAAGLSKRLWPLTLERPKCLLEINGRTLLERQIDQLRRNAIKHIYIVVGHAADKVIKSVPPAKDLFFIYNEEYATSNNSISLYKALNHVQGDFIYLMSDYIWEEELLARVIKRNTDFGIAVDFTPSLINDEVKVLTRQGEINRIRKDIDTSLSNGRFAGAVKIGAPTALSLREVISGLIISGEKNLYSSQILDRIIERGLVKAYAIDVTGIFWNEIDTPEDLSRCREMKI